MGYEDKHFKSLTFVLTLLSMSYYLQNINILAN